MFVVIGEELNVSRSTDTRHLFGTSVTMAGIHMTQLLSTPIAGDVATVHTRGEVPAHVMGAVPSLGSYLGDYRLERCLGRGGMGQVYVARSMVTNELVALKFVAFTKPANLYRFKREFRALAKGERVDHRVVKPALPQLPNLD